MQSSGLEVVHEWPMMLAAAGEESEEAVKADESETAGEPTAEEFAEEQLRSGQRLGEQWKESSIFPLRRNLPRGGCDGNDQRSNPNEQETDFFEVTDDAFVVEDVDGGHDQANEDGQDEQDVKVLTPIKFFDDDARDGEDVFHGTDWNEGVVE
jgi:hypothetical protein